MQSVAVIPCGELSADKERSRWWGGGELKMNGEKAANCTPWLDWDYFGGWDYFGIHHFCGGNLRLHPPKNVLLYYSTILSTKPVDGTVCRIKDTVIWAQVSPSDYLVGLIIHWCGENRCLLSINLVEIRSAPPGQGATTQLNTTILISITAWSYHRRTS